MVHEISLHCNHFFLAGEKELGILILSFSERINTLQMAKNGLNILLQEKN